MTDSTTVDVKPADAKPAKAKPAKAKPAKDDAVPIGGIKGKPEQKRLKIEDIKRLPSFQVRGTTNEARAEALAEVLKAGEELPRPKVIQVDKYPQHAVEDGPYFLLFDGFHTTRAHEINGKATVDVDVWVGSYQDGIIAASKANQEWDKQGVPRSNADKVRAVHLFAKAFADTPKSELPSNRQIAEIIGVSRQTVNNVDPFGRNTNGRSHDDVLAQKRVASKAKAAEPEPAAEPPKAGKKTFVFTSKATNSVLGRIEAVDAEAAIALATDIHPTWVSSPYTCREEKAAAPGAVKGPGHDFGRLDGALGALIREWDAATGAAGVRGKPEGLAGVRLLDEVAAVVKKFLDKHKPKAR